MTKICGKPHLHYLALALFLVCCGGTVPAQARPANGTILEQQPLHLTATYEDWISRAYDPAHADPLDPKPQMDRVRRYYTAARYLTLNGDGDVRVDRIVYASDGLRIRGVRMEPKRTSAKLPVIVWCHGGVGESSRLYTDELIRMSVWAREGFIVLASQYRGNAGSEGKDEQGGADVHDVNALAVTAAQLPEADPRNLFLYGESRGGMMVYESLRAGFAARAAVINSGVSDAGGYKDRPDAKEMEELARESIPNFEREKQAGFESRSAVRWASELHTPLLLLHGTADWRVSPMQSLAMAEALQKSKRSYALHLFQGGTHVNLSGDTEALDSEVLRFFQDHQIH